MPLTFTSVPKIPTPRFGDISVPPSVASRARRYMREYGDDADFLAEDIAAPNVEDCHGE